MGKKKTAVIGSENEDQIKAKKAVKLEQKKLREGKAPKVDEVVTEAHPAPAPAPTASPTTPASKSKSTPKSHRSKAYKSAKAAISVDKLYQLPDGLKLLRQVSVAKFDGTVELHLVLKRTPNSKLAVNLPHAFGRSKKIAIADDTFVAGLESGKSDLDLDYIVASPAQMAKLVRFAKILGPKGLMPNPKNGTVSDKPEEAAKRLAADTAIQLKLDKTGPVIHTSIGKLSFSDTQLSDNIQAVINTVSGNLKKVVLKSSMSPAIKLMA